MRRSKFSESQIVEILRKVEARMPLTDVIRKHSISSATFLTWRAKQGRVTIAEINCLQELEQGNTKLKRMYANLALEDAAEDHPPPPFPPK